MVSNIISIFYYIVPINVPSLKTLHLNCCFEGMEHTSLLEFISFMYKYPFNVVPYIIIPDIKEPKNIPLNKSPITILEKTPGTQANDFLINKSNTI